MNFKKFDVSDNQWHDIPYYQHKTATDTLTLPAVIYPNDTSITVGIKGNTTQSGTPSPQNPVVISGTGDLETTGEHAGQYKISISSAGQTTPVYLGEVPTTRRIKKFVLTGSEGGTWSYNVTIRNGNGFYNANIFTGYKPNVGAGYCTHYPLATVQTDTIGVFFGGNINFITDFAEGIDTADKWKTYLQQQYANGTPVTVWYVLATPQTAIVNEPLMKIGSYADSLTTSIPCTAGENTLDVQTTVQPSEASAGFSGWHPVQSVHERENGQWD